MRSVLVGLLTLTVAVLGALTPAHAATATIEGTVVFPAGYDPTTADLPSVIRIPVGSATRRYFDVATDGSFTVTGLETGTQYHLLLDDYSQELLGGWVTADGTVSESRADARVFEGPGTVSVVAEATATIRGQIVVPPGTDAGDVRPSIYASYHDGSTWRSEGRTTIRPDLTFTVFGLREGETYRLDFRDNDHVLLDGYVGAGGAIVDAAEAATFTASTTGLAIRPARSLPIAGRATLPAGSDYASASERTWVTLWERRVGTDQFDDTYIVSELANDGSFHLIGTRSDRDYLLRVRNNHREWEDGWVGPGGELVENTWQAQTVHGGATGIKVTLRPHTQISGTVELPAGFTYDAEAPPTVAPVSLGWNYYDEVFEWWPQSSAPVAADGSFTTRRTHSQTDFRLLLTWPDGREVYWTSNHTVPTPDADAAATTRPRGDVVFPASNRMIDVTAPRISGEARLGATLRADGGTWTAPSPTLTYQWLRGGKAIPGATGRTYKVQAADAGSRLAARVTASAPGFPRASATTPQTAVVPRLTPTTAVTVLKKGTTRSKVRLRVRVGTDGAVAKPTGTLRVKYGSKSRTVKLKAKHRGVRTVTIPRTKARGKVTVRYSPTGTSAKALTGATGTVKVTKVAPQVRVKSAKKISRSTRARLVVRVTTSLTAKPTGKVKVTYGTKPRTVKLKPRDKGKVTVRLPRLAKGKHKIRVKYMPAKTYKPYLKTTRSKTTTIRVR